MFEEVDGDQKKMREHIMRAGSEFGRLVQDIKRLKSNHAECLREFKEAADALSRANDEGQRHLVQRGASTT